MAALEVERPLHQFNSEVFKPDKEPLLIRGTIGNVFDESQNPNGRISKMKSRKPFLRDVPPLAERPIESHMNLPSPRGLDQGSPRRSRPATKSSSRFGAYSQASFFSRHNPHPFRVRHIEGLNGQPICAVHDHDIVPSARFSIRTPSTREREKIFRAHIPPNALGLSSTTFPINVITGLQHYPFREKAVPRIGLIPITDSWRDELRELCEKAGLLPDILTEQPPAPVQQSILPEQRRKTVYSSETGRIVPPPSRAMSRQASRQRMYPTAYQHISAFPDTETIMLELLCQILQTDSVHEVQQWLVSAGEREKALVLDMIRSAMGNEEEILRQQEAEKQDAFAAANKAARPQSVHPASRPNTAVAMVSSRPATGAGVRPGTSQSVNPVKAQTGGEIATSSPRKSTSARPLGTPSRAASRRVLDEVKAGNPTMRYTKTPNSPLRSRGHPVLPAIQENIHENSAIVAT